MQEFDKLIDAGPHLLDLDGLLDRVEIVRRPAPLQRCR